MLEKFPVISSNGNEYLVKVKECFLFVAHYEIRVYEKYTGWFGRERYRLLNDDSMGFVRSYDARKYDFDLAKMAQYEVARMESEWEAQDLLEKNLLEAENKFKKWDGVCK